MFFSAEHSTTSAAAAAQYSLYSAEGPTSLAVAQDLPTPVVDGVDIASYDPTAAIGATIVPAHPMPAAPQCFAGKQMRPAMSAGAPPDFSADVEWLECTLPSEHAVAPDYAAGVIRKQAWISLVSSDVGREVCSYLKQGSIAKLDAHIIATSEHLDTYTLILTAAQVRGGLEDHEHTQLKADEMAKRLYDTAALVTASAWPAKQKVDALTRIRTSLLRQGRDLSAFDIGGENYLHVAVRTRTTGEDLKRLVSFFLESGLDVNRVNGALCPPIILLKDHPDCMPALSVMLVNNADPNLPDAFGYTLMHHLAAHPQAMPALHAAFIAGGNYLAVTPRGETLLHMLLANRDDPQTVAYLLQQGVLPSHTDRMGWNAADYAIMGRRYGSRLLLGVANENHFGPNL